LVLAFLIAFTNAQYIQFELVIVVSHAFAGSGTTYLLDRLIGDSGLRVEEEVV
jgi:hypothetical protein